MKFESSWAEGQRKPAEEDMDRLPTDKELARLQRTTVLYYLHETNPGNGLVRDKTDPDASRATGSTVGGFTACDGPGWVKRSVNGVEREFYGYIARGAPFGPDDGTVAPWVVVASLPFAPEIVIPTIRQFARLDLGMTAPYGFKPSFNQTFAVDERPTGWWVTPYHFGIDQGPVVLMIENYRSGLIWDIMRRCPAVIAGLRRAGFTGGWL